jgi:hypothetical protein
MKDVDQLKTEMTKLEAKIAQLQKEQTKITEWILWRKIEAGAITANGLEQLDKATHACSVIKHVVDDIKKMTVLLAEVTKLPRITELIAGEHGEKYDKKILRDLENADAVSKSAVIFLLQVKDLILEADLKLKSSGWLSDRPPEIPKPDVLACEPSPPLTEERIGERETTSNDHVFDEIFLEPKTLPAEHQRSQGSRELEELQESLRTVRNQKKNLKNKMLQRRNSIHLTDEEKAERYPLDAAKVEEFNETIQKLVNDIEKISFDGPSQSTLSTEIAKERYIQATLRNSPADEAMVADISVTKNF